MKQTTKPLAYNLRFLRRKYNLTQEQAATKCKLSLRLYQKLELEQGNPTLQSLNCISEAYEINLGELLSLTKISLKVDENVFISNYKNTFSEVNIPVGIRTTEGDFIWKNDALVKDLNYNSDLKEEIQSNQGMILQYQLDNERKGHFHSYLNSITGISGPDRLRRWFPIAIISENAMTLNLVAVYVVDLRKVDLKEYFKYCNLLLQCT
jgi:transcriptional regulator with XRE-family HTH domain